MNGLAVIAFIILVVIVVAQMRTIATLRQHLRNASHDLRKLRDQMTKAEERYTRRHSGFMDFDS